MVAKLRQFLYRDDDLIREFLAQLEGGVFDSDTQTTRSAGSRRGGGRLKVGAIEGGGERGSEESEEIERVVRQTGASEFNRLYESLEEVGAVQFVDNIDETIWNQIERGEILELEAVVAPAGLGKVAEMFQVFSSLAPIFEATGATTGNEIDDETKRIMNLVTGLSSHSPEVVPLVITLASAPRFRFAANLRADHILVQNNLLEGEATVLAKLQRKLKAGECYLAAPLLGGLESVLPEKDQGELVEMFDHPEVQKLGIASPSVTAPGGVLTPIAIFR